MIVQDAADYIRHADMLFVDGTSVSVCPAAGLIDCYRGNKLVLINKAATKKDRVANLVIYKPIGEVFTELQLNQ